MDFWEIENALFADGYKTICGVDEAGRGPLAGPVFAAAVVLPPWLCIPGLDDSKKLSEKKRERLFGEITANAVAYGIAEASSSEIDEINILNATFLAMNRAIEKLKVTPDIAIIDGNQNFGITCRSICAVGGDGRSASVAAASILAKVSRDRLMARLAEQYPQYGFERHKGYPTKRHYDMLEEYGPSEIHRFSYKLKR